CLALSDGLVSSVLFDCTVREAVDSVVRWVSRLCSVACCDELDFFFRIGVGSAAMVLVSSESVVALVFCWCLLSCDDEPEVDEPLVVDDDADPGLVDGSADATPWPTKTAAAIPSATTTNPTIRPTYTPTAIPTYMYYRRNARPSAAWRNRSS